MGWELRLIWLYVGDRWMVQRRNSWNISRDEWHFRSQDTYLHGDGEEIGGSEKLRIELTLCPGFEFRLEKLPFFVIFSSRVLNIGLE
jgi:hypothetical protein